MKKYKAVIMDFDLTIADTAGLIEECLYRHALGYGYDLDRTILRDGIGKMAGTIFMEAGVPAELVDEMDRTYVEYSADIMCQKTEFFPGVAEGFEALSGRGVKLAVLSLKAAPQIWAPLERCGLDGFVTQVLGKDEVSRGKPDPEGIFLLSEQLGVTLDDIIYVGDSYTDQQAASAAGVDFGAVCTGAVSAENFAKNKTAGIYPDFGALCRDLCCELDK